MQRFGIQLSLDLTTCYNFIPILELKEVDTAKVGGELDYKHTDANHEDDLKGFVIVKRLYNKLPYRPLDERKSVYSVYVVCRLKPQTDT